MSNGNHLLEPLPESVRKHLRSTAHPGLWLDRFAQSWSTDLEPDKLSKLVQQPTCQQVVNCSQGEPAGFSFDGLLKQRAFCLKARRAEHLRATTDGPLTLHLSRASSLENAGICLHRIHGFAYLPGSGIKGMARAFAETIWLPSQSDENVAKQKINDVFGWAPSNGKREKQRDDDSSPAQHVGRIVFHDAWPQAWPKLHLDILANHHKKYYSDKNSVPPPGDWEEPNPVYFLAVNSGVEFDFALSPWRAEDAELISLAKEWLVGALTYCGAGAKTNAGYGNFRMGSGVSDATVMAAHEHVASAKNRIRRTLELKLATPAFLAGAEAANSDTCDLRVPTLRGQLRWWWRTLHAAHLDPSDLRRLESAIWGSTTAGGATRITLTPQQQVQPLPFDREDIVRRNRLPAPPNNKTTQGLTYLSYGMDEMRERQRVRRYYIPPETTWTATITIRPYMPIEEKDKKKPIDQLKTPLSIEQIERQVMGAFELLCRFGGVGSKSRNGYGNFHLPSEFPEHTLKQCLSVVKAEARKLRTELKLRLSKSESPALDDLLIQEIVATPWMNYWLALDAVGSAAQSFAQSKKHQNEKKALGLPRIIGRPATGNFRVGKDVGSRHASPIHYHLSVDEKGLYRVLMLAFPAHRLPDLETSRTFLGDALSRIHANLGTRTAGGRGAEQTIATGPSQSAIASATAALGPKAGEAVQATLSDERTKKGGWMATYQGKTGAITNHTLVPEDKQPGEIVELVINSWSDKAVAFRWPTPTDQKKDSKNSGKKKGGK